MSMDFTAAFRLAEAAREERKGRLDNAFRRGPDQISRYIREDSMQFVASMDMPLESYTESDLRAAIQERMRNDPLFHARVEHGATLVEEYMQVALEHWAR